MTPLVHFEIHADDIERAKKFYGAVFGWEFSTWKGEGFDYTMVMTQVEGKGINGGIVQRRGPAPAEGQPVNGFVCTMEVASLDETLGIAMKEGGSIALPRMDMPGVGALAYCKDTEGNIFGILEAEKKAA